MGYLDFYEDEEYGVPNMFPYPEVDLNDYYGINLKNIIISFYFTYTAMQQYVRTITQGVKLSDNRRLTRTYTRSVTQTATVNSLLKRIMAIYGKCISMAHTMGEINTVTLFFRSLIDHITITTRKKEIQSFVRECIETVKINSCINGLQHFFRRLHDDLSGFDMFSSSMIFLRVKKENAGVRENVRQWRVFIRGIPEIAENAGEIAHTAHYKRLQSSTLRAQGAVVRSIFMVIRIITKLFIRDYILGRFLKSKTELTLKSRIVQEISITSRLNE